MEIKDSLYYLLLVLVGILLLYQIVAIVWHTSVLSRGGDQATRKKRIESFQQTFGTLGLGARLTLACVTGIFLSVVYLMYQWFTKTHKAVRTQMNDIRKELAPDRMMQRAAGGITTTAKDMANAAVDTTSNMANAAYAQAWKTPKRVKQEAKKVARAASDVATGTASSLYNSARQVWSDVQDVWSGDWVGEHGFR